MTQFGEILRFILEEKEKYYSHKVLSEKLGITEKALARDLEIYKEICKNPVLKGLEPPFWEAGSAWAGVTTFFSKGYGGDKLQQLVNLYNAQLSIMRWLEKTKWDEKVDEFKEIFWIWLENLIYKTKNSEDSSDSEWHELDEGNKSDGGVDSYAEYQDENGLANLIILQAKSRSLQAIDFRGLIGTLHLIEKSTKYRNRFIPKVSNVQFVSIEGLMVTSKSTSSIWLKHYNEFKPELGKYKFAVLDPWALSSHLCFENDDLKLLTEEEGKEKKYLREILSIVSRSGEREEKYFD